MTKTFLLVASFVSSFIAFAQSNKTLELQFGTHPLFDDMKLSIKFAWCACPRAGRGNTDGFWISTTELTRLQFDSIIGGPLSGLSTPFTKGFAEYDDDLGMHVSYSPDMPMDNMDYRDAQMLLDVMNRDKRIAVTLPSRQQWLIACNQLPQKYNVCSILEYAWFINNSNGRPHPVGGKKPNSIGLYDMQGNVQELVTTGELSSKDRLTDDNTVEIGGTYRDQAYSASSEVPIFTFKQRSGIRLCIKNVNSKTFNKGYHVWRCTDESSFIRSPMCFEQRNIDKISAWAAQCNIGVVPCTISQSSYRGCGWPCDFTTLPDNLFVSIQALTKLYNLFHETHAKADELEKSWRKLSGAGNVNIAVKDEPKVTPTVRDAIFNSRRVLCRISYDYMLWNGLYENNNAVQKLLLQYNKELCAAKQQLCEADALVLKELAMQEEKETQDKRLEQWRSSCTTPEKIYERYRECFATITIGDSAGSGFIVRENGIVYLYTNRHVVENCGRAKIFVAGNKGIKCAKLEYAENMDIVRARVVNWKSIKGDILEFRYDPPKLDERIMVIGNSDGLGLQTIGKGTILGVSAKEDVIEISAEIVGGNSGGAVLDSLGKVIGIATFALQSENDWIKAGTRYSKARRFALRPQGNVRWQVK